jgi:hypothetical protein
MFQTTNQELNEPNETHGAMASRLNLNLHD